MSDISFLLTLLVVSSFIVCSCLVRGNRLLGFIIAWNFFWLFISTLNLLKSDYLPLKANLLFIFYLFTISLVAACKTKNNSFKAINTNFEQELTLLGRLIIYLSFIVLPVLVYLSIKSFTLLQQVSIYNFRTEVFSSDSGILPTGFLPIFNLFIGGLSKFIVLSSIYIFCTQKKFSFLVLAILVSTLMSLVTLGRFPLYELGFIFILTLYDKKLFKMKHFLVLSFGLIILVWFSVYRSDGYFSVIDVLNKHILGYHTFGFYLLETKIENTSVIEDSWGGVASLGSFGYFLTLPITWITDFTTYMQSNYFVGQVDFQKVGLMPDGSEMQANAFYTILYEPYLDFGILGVFIFSFFCGVIISQLNTSSNKSVYNDLLLVFIALILTTGIMKNPLIRHDVILPIIIFSLLIFKRSINSNVNDEK